MLFHQGTSAHFVVQDVYAYFSCKSIGGHRNDGMSGGGKRARKKQMVGKEGKDRGRRGRDAGGEVRGVSGGGGGKGNGGGAWLWKRERGGYVFGFAGLRVWAEEDWKKWWLQCAIGSIIGEFTNYFPFNY